ncbi:MAG TPA: orc1/cdc6 family replication initiation protein [Nitrososphaeraceae archaeon]|nr:orc1/cdc6 family replication initiation protein [Nitrososphaeraceae archaeon]
MSDDLLDSIFEKIATGKTLIKNRRTLTIDYVPENLPFRDEESKTIAQALSVVLKGARTSNLLLFGKPGTGKTAVVKNVIEHLRKKAEELGIEVTVPLVNAKTANTAYKVLYEIAEEIGINKKEESKLQVPFTGLSMGEATDRILDFIQKKKLHVVLVIDEIDSLVDKNGDDVLYNFTRANERISEGGFISLIGISNSLTFKDKLDPRVRSSLSEEEMVFNPYTVEQLQKILTDRVKLAFNDDVISGAAINLCAAMAGRENGDARKAIDLLRVAAEIAERERASKVEEKHIKLAQEKIEKDTNYEVIKNSTTHTKIVTLAIMKSKNGNTGEVYEIYSSLCKHIEQEPLTQRRITQIINELDQLGLAASDVVSQGRYGRSQKIKITVPALTVKEALKDDPILSTLLIID